MSEPECDCYPGGFTADTYEGPKEDCPVHGRQPNDPPNPSYREQRQSWGWRDSRTGMRWSASTTRTREQAEAELQGWRDRDARGKRPDLHDALPFVEVFLVWDSRGTAED